MIPLGTIRDEVCKELGIDRITFETRRNAQRYSAPRHLAWWLAKQLTTHSFPVVGRHLGTFDHSTVIHGIRRHERRMRESAEHARLSQRLLDRLRDRDDAAFDFVGPALAERMPGMAVAPCQVRVGDFVEAIRALGKRVEVVDRADPPYHELMACWRASHPEAG